MIEKLKPEELRRTFSRKQLPFDSTESLKPLGDIIGQERAVSALQFGLGIREAGFNVYVAGPPGVGKMTVVRTFLEEIAGREQRPPDWCYVYNFEDSYQPRCLRLPPGTGRALRKEMQDLVEHVRRAIPKIFENEEYQRKRGEMVKAFAKQKARLQDKINEKAAAQGFSLQQTSMGVMIIPLRGGKPLGEAEVAKMTPAEREALGKRRGSLEEFLKKSFKEMRGIDKSAQEKLKTLDTQVVLYVVGGIIDDIAEKHKETRQVADYLKAVRKDILENLDAFKAEQGEPDEGSAPGARGPWSKELLLRRYEVNLLVDNSGVKGAPLIVERNPIYGNLVGRVEKETHLGTLHTDHTLIKAGSLHQANGGYLVLPVDDVLHNTMSWDGLKRALRTGEVEIEDLSDRLGFISTKSLRPQPVPLDVKVVLVGQSLLYSLLHAYDEEFSELFKVKADFEVWMDATDANVRDFADYLCALCRREKLRHLEAGAVGKLLEHAGRLAEDQSKLSIYFGSLADVVREANYWAARDEKSRIGADHVRKAIDERVHRSNLIEKHLREMIARGTLLIRVSGEAPGQVNGLSVIETGGYAFGRPSRITASVGPGRDGIVDIDREVELGGPIHSKGVLILAGYLMLRFGAQRPLSLSGRLVFEQSYDGVEGDSASSAELYALLSALSGLPIRQGIAVTGSVNQRGEIQAIGGVNEKIEGFFDICSVLGLDGRQGVLIPKSNVRNLMLREDVVDAVRQGKFHVWAAGTVEEGIELLTARAAGVRGKDGKFPKGSVCALVDARLKEFGEALKEMPDSVLMPVARDRRDRRSKARRTGKGRK